jgi:hypothetical protein
VTTALLRTPHCSVLVAAEPFWKTLQSLTPMSISFRRERERRVAAHRHSNEVAEVYHMTQTHVSMHVQHHKIRGFVMMEIGQRGVRQEGGVV